MAEGLPERFAEGFPAEAIGKASRNASGSSGALLNAVKRELLEHERRCSLVSRGSGRLMRRIVAILEQAPEREMNRKDLDDVLVAEGFREQNILRAVKSLARRRLVSFNDAYSKEESVVRLPRKVRALSDDEIAEVLQEIGGGK